MARDKVERSDRTTADDRPDGSADKPAQLADSGPEQAPDPGGSEPIEEPADPGGPGTRSSRAKPAGTKKAAAKKTTAKKTTAKKAAAKPPAARKPTGGGKATEAGKATGAKATSAKTTGAKAGGAKSAENGKPRRADSGTGASAARTRGVMQRRHLRIGFAMTAGLGAELVAVAGLIAGSLLAWEWGDPLWGRTEAVWLIGQIALALTVLLLAAAWLLRPETNQARARAASVVPAATVAVLALALLWQAEPGSRGVGPAVTLVAALLAIAGAVGWLLGLRRLRVLFPFGLADARSRGFGNLPAVRRAKFVGGPVGAVGGAALVAGALLVAPGWVTTVDSQTAQPLALPDELPTATGDPAWTIELAGAHEGQSMSVWATPGGLVIEELAGVRAVDPRTGEAHWHWRDDAYQRVAGVMTDAGRTVVLAMSYEGETTGRDRVIALDTSTGEVRWERFDDELVAAMATIVVSGEAGNWFVVPAEGQSPAVQDEPSLALRAVDGDSGETRWAASEEQGCAFTSVTGDAAGAVVTTQQCTGDGDPAAGAPPSCLLTGLDPADGQRMWSWPAEATDDDSDEAAGSPASDCQVAATPELLLVSYQQPAGPAAVALDPITGDEIWATTDADELVGLRNPVLVGDALAGTEWIDDGAGGGHGELVIRDAANGEIRDRVELPEGQPIEVEATGPARAAIAHYRPETTEVVLLEVDLDAAELRHETVVGASAADDQFRRLTLTGGPSALVIEALVVSGADPDSADYTMLVHGW